MLEDPNVSLRILRYFAQDDVPYPANAEFDDVAAELSDIDKPTLAYHLKVCIDADLLDGNCVLTETFGGSELLFGWLHGLTSAGSDLVRYAARRRRWRKALRLARRSGSLTTQVVARVAADLVAHKLGLNGG